jgi:hypothetical protein
MEKKRTEAGNRWLLEKSVVHEQYVNSGCDRKSLIRLALRAEKG